MEIYLVRDEHTDLYGAFSTRAGAQKWIDRQRTLGYPWALVIEPMPLDSADDLR
jgi:hypothetical protein